MINLKSAEPYLWKVAQELPYKEPKFSTTSREFTPSYAQRQAQDFKEVVLSPRIKLG
jgi:hypothetical protein